MRDPLENASGDPSSIVQHANLTLGVRKRLVIIMEKSVPFERALDVIRECQELNPAPNARFCSSSRATPVPLESNSAACRANDLFASQSGVP